MNIDKSMSLMKWTEIEWFIFDCEIAENLFSAIRFVMEQCFESLLEAEEGCFFNFGAIAPMSYRCLPLLLGNSFGGWKAWMMCLGCLGTLGFCQLQETTQICWDGCHGLMNQRSSTPPPGLGQNSSSAKAVNFVRKFCLSIGMNILVRAIRCSHPAFKKIKRTCLLHQWNGKMANLQEKMAFTLQLIGKILCLPVDFPIADIANPMAQDSHRGLRPKGRVDAPVPALQPGQPLASIGSTRTVDANGKRTCAIGQNRIYGFLMFLAIHPILGILIRVYRSRWKWIDSSHPPMLVFPPSLTRSLRSRNSTVNQPQAQAAGIGDHCKSDRELYWQNATLQRWSLHHTESP